MVLHKIKGLLRRAKTFRAKLPALNYFYQLNLSDAQVALLLNENGFSCQAFHCVGITENFTRIIFAESSTFGAVVIKVCFKPCAAESLARNSTNLKNLKKLDLGRNIIVPKNLFNLTAEVSGASVFISVETRITGEPATVFLYSDQWEQVLRRCFGAWKQHMLSSTCKVDLKHKIVFEHLSGFRRFFKIAPTHSNIDTILDFLGGQVTLGALDWLHVGPTHGDFWLGNVLLPDCSDSIGVIDWEAFKEQGLADVDLLHLLLYTHAQRKHISLAKAWRDLFLMDASEVNLTTYGFYDLKQFKIVMIIYWLVFLTTRPWPKKQSWLENFVTVPLGLSIKEINLLS